MGAVVTVKNLSKTFQLNRKESRSIRDIVLHPFKSPDRASSFKALENINFEIQQGEFFGIIGRNGSGKSTLLNCLMGSIRPDMGSIVKTKGKMIRLALGMGFDPNLSARDNIYVNGSILGLTFKRIGLIFDDIIGFAELEQFVDVPVKQFSSGMMAKLKFSIAVHAEADIFLMDEFFGGVGDISFKRKSEKVFKDTFLDGRTIIHVSHQLQTIKENCSQVLVINKGKQICLDKPRIAIPQYNSLFQNTSTLKPK